MSVGESQKGVSMIALGISAIDMLCCAMVSGLVMFLVLSSPIQKSEAGQAPGDASGLQIHYHPQTQGVIFALRFVNPDTRQHAEIFSDRARPMHFILDRRILDPLLQSTGTLFEHETSLPTPGTTADRTEYFYIIRRLYPVKWDIGLTYADTRQELASSIPEWAHATVDLKGVCSVHLQCDVRAGDSVSLSGCKNETPGSCNVAQIVNGLARKSTQPQAP